MFALFLVIALTAVCSLLVDWYTFKVLRQTFTCKAFLQGRTFSRLYWASAIGLVVALFLGVYTHKHLGFRAGLLLGFTLVISAKIAFLFFAAIDDIRRLIIRLKRKPAPASNPEPKAAPAADVIPRSEFLVKAGILASAIPLAGMGIGMVTGPYNYKLIRQNLYLPNLPKAFDGMTIGQISDLHSGSLYNKRAVEGGVDLLMHEKPEVIFFTGDLVNDRAYEMNYYLPTFSKVKAPLGVFSILGNHDYGDYTDYWPEPGGREQNRKDIREAHRLMGWDLLMNENRRLKVNGEEIGILGIENWGSYSSFPKRGRMDLATKNTDDLPVKLLLSHDPTHWRAEVLPQYQQIDMTFSGHTHGMQFGVRTPEFQWSPIKYIYPEWAGLYREGAQQIYVNVGLGFIGYPGRLGILPEITIFTLKAGTDPSLKAGA